MVISVLLLPVSSLATPLWRQVDLHTTVAPASLASMAERAADNLRSAKQRVCCFESTSGGLIQAALLASPGASAFTTCGAVTYTMSRSVGVLGPMARPVDEPLDKQGHRCRPKDGAEYIKSKQQRTRELAQRKRIECGADWCVCENGACAPV